MLELISISKCDCYRHRQTRFLKFSGQFIRAVAKSTFPTHDVEGEVLDKCWKKTTQGKRSKTCCDFCETFSALPSSKTGGPPKISDHKITINCLGQSQLDGLMAHLDSIRRLYLYSSPDARVTLFHSCLASGLIISVIVFTTYLR